MTRRWLVGAAAPLVAVSLLLGAVRALGRLAADDLRQHDRFATSFERIVCEPPAPPVGPQRRFLREVQYEAELPDRLDRLDPALATRLRSAFRRHPWVEEVERVEVRPRGAICVRMRYRTPALAVRDGGRLRVVDGNGVVLPRAAEAAQVPSYRGKATRPAGRAGTAWEDEQVRAAARAAALLRPQWQRLRLKEVECDGNVIYLWAEGGTRTRWERP